ncbi:MAG TPA: glutamate synthase large subunit [Candidatus Dormibacteraeota bacterium]|jgi:glutamate synthase domain-containing protein 2/glutamate synthase domain-containing protein 1/glutamate synthase domain-containing protein 3|nr:glutamate synthase large subunit [Candidatus Dormibacteraeota bacterium]
MTPPRHPEGLYDPQFEHDACGVAFVASIAGERSHSIVAQGIEALVNLGHRGACGCDPNTGDGAGILIQVPDAFFRRVSGVDLPPRGEYGVGMLFLPTDEHDRAACERIVAQACEDEGVRLLGWRDVPHHPEAIGWLAREGMPAIRQIFVGSIGLLGDTLERRLYVLRKVIERRVAESGVDAEHLFYICSLSARTLVYKGMLIADQISPFYPDLSEADVVSSLALVHARFSTNVLPRWDIAQPFRYIAHNGEINTLRGNVNWMRARQSKFKSPMYGDDIAKLLPVIDERGSDSSQFDNAVEMLAMTGRPVEHAMMMTIPEAWHDNKLMDADRRAFYEFHSSLLEPWDGPAAIAFTDGRVIGATLDRNGLRPARWLVTRDGLVVMASEAGVLDIAPGRIERKWRLEPGRLLLVDTVNGRILDDGETKSRLATQHPYREWIRQGTVYLHELEDSEQLPEIDKGSLLIRQQMFGYTQEDLKFLLAPMIATGEEPVGSMGNDTPPAVLSEKPQPLFNYFKQLFAQVTNPPIDPIREQMVMSLVTTLGTGGNLLEQGPAQARRLEMPHPVLTNGDLGKLRHVTQRAFPAATLHTTFHRSEGDDGLQRALDRICRLASEKIAEGYAILVLSDRTADAEHVPIPSLLATAAVHHHLVREATRTSVGLVVESGEPREVQHFALLIGYGAEAVNPYLAFESFHELERRGLLPEGVHADKAQAMFVKAVNKGLLKTISKMGISTIQSYCGAQIFEAIGIARTVIDRYFTGTASRIGGVGLDVIAREALARHSDAYPENRIGDPVLDEGGNYQWRRTGEHHHWNPETIATIQHAVKANDVAWYRDYARMVNDNSRQMKTLRGLFDLKPLREPVPIEEVEPASSIVRRFATGAMSLGSISPEAHETLAIAMNRIGGKSNTGEGGEDERRYQRDANGDWRRSAIKQVASARFGVTINYLVNADELQIKIAQGAKPGEGGQLPGHKVDEYIAKLRHSTPGVGLISPPPHHDIYSIEDLAQLIHDLKNANPRARISVKLVAEVGVGTVAAGVSKAHADHIVIAGYDGGTGASPLSSIKHAGIPWEIGLAETQQVLVMNDLRSRVVLQADGQMKTGRDVVIGALLGAEEFGFATSALVATGCIMMRVCHLNTCPVGIATQDPQLRDKYAGKAEYVVNFFTFIAEDVREIMASLGFRSFDEMIGQVEHLDMRAALDHWKQRGLDFSAILHKPVVAGNVDVRKVIDQDHGLARALDHELIALCEPALERGEPVQVDLPVRNQNRTVGGMLSGRIALRYGSNGLPHDTIRIGLSGSAGQSLGAWLARGVTLTLRGDANDYVGKGLSGGRIVVMPPEGIRFVPEENIIVGNVVLYGATSGEAFFRGVAGERFCVRNSGAHAVVEGVGDHGCEYMTGGIAVVLGRTGRNFAAGMSGGVAYVLDEEGTFAERCNHGMVELESLDDEDLEALRSLLQRHRDYTGSGVAERVLLDWDRAVQKFVKVMPVDYKRVLLARRSVSLELVG